MTTTEIKAAAKNDATSLFKTFDTISAKEWQKQAAQAFYATFNVRGLTQDELVTALGDYRRFAANECNRMSGF